jgi:hypothetical protein
LLRNPPVGFSPIWVKIIKRKNREKSGKIFKFISKLFTFLFYESDSSFYENLFNGMKYLERKEGRGKLIKQMNSIN